MHAVLSCFSYGEVDGFIANDILVVVDYLTKLGVPQDNIIILTDVPNLGRTVRNKHEYVAQLANWLNSDRRENLFLYWSCHAAKGGIMFPYNGTAVLIPKSTINHLLSELHKSVQVMCILDCCYAEGLVRARWKVARFGNVLFNWDNLSCDMIVLASCGYKETSGFDNAMSLFTRHCFNYLTAKKNASLFYFLVVAYRVSKHRARRGNPAQTVSVLITHRHRSTFFDWL